MSQNIQFEFKLTRCSIVDTSSTNRTSLRRWGGVRLMTEWTAIENFEIFNMSNINLDTRINNIYIEMNMSKNFNINMSMDLDLDMSMSMSMNINQQQWR
jgi:hypothetical protein